jgi:predicted metal-binding membrane protein
MSIATANPQLERVLQRDRVIAIASLVLVVALSWVYILGSAGMSMPAGAMSGAGSTPMSDMMVSRGVWSGEYAVLVFVMWCVMMLAMMLPSAAPMILLYAALNRKHADGSLRSVAAFVLAWGGFSGLATGAQWALEKTALLSPMMEASSTYLGGALLIAAGIWQLTPLKHACLRHCRSPIQFFAQSWRGGLGGAFLMGLEHGAFCLGCCWVMMGLLFYGGVMNLLWILGLAVYVLIEKTVPAGHFLGRGVGGLLVAWGVWVIVAAR